MKIDSSIFGQTKEGRDVTKYVLTNDNGASVSVITYGGIITEINVPDKDGKLGCVVLGHNDMKGYYEASPFFGAITGRFAGRISNASFTIGEETYTLPKNNNGNCLHGGLVGFDKVVWDATEIQEADYVAVALNYLSADMEEGFPGNLDTTVLYKWDNTNTLTLTYKATTDKETLVTLTNHTYFNLSGDPSSTILDHTLWIDADKYGVLNSELMPLDVADVAGTPFDFTTAKAIGDAVKATDNEQIQFGGGVDHPFALNGRTNPQIILADPKSGRKMEISTDEACVVCYSGNFISDYYAYDNIQLQKQGGVCLETQYYPDNINFDKVETKTLKPNETYKQTTAFKFSC